MTLTTIAAPDEVFDATDAVLRQSLRLQSDETDQNDLISALVVSARQKVEAYTRRRLLTQTVRYMRDGFSYFPIDLPIGPIQNVESVEYLNGSGAWTEVSAADYKLVTSRQPNTLVPSYGKSWPVPRLERANVRIDLVVGYGDISAVPAPLIHAIRLLVAHLFLHREAVVTGGGSEVLPMGVQDLLNDYVFWV